MKKIFEIEKSVKICKKILFIFNYFVVCFKMVWIVFQKWVVNNIWVHSFKKYGKSADLAKNTIKNIWGWNRPKNKNIQPEQKKGCAYKKKSVDKGAAKINEIA